MGIPESIKKLRESHGLSQAEFGKIVGVSDKAVSTWENGLKTPRMGAIQKIADYYGISKSEIIDGKPLLPPNAILGFKMGFKMGFKTKRPHLFGAAE